jgi:small nuclear ribonucleoprotein (snRNP)-like protein
MTAAKTKNNYFRNLLPITVWIAKIVASKAAVCKKYQNKHKRPIKRNEFNLPHARMASRAEKDAVVDFAKYCDQRVRVRFQGGREVDGVLKGFDKLDNLVLDDAVEYLRGSRYR